MMRTIPKQTMAITLGVLLAMSAGLARNSNAQTVLGPGDLGGSNVTIEDDYAYPQNGEYDYGVDTGDIEFSNANPAPGETVTITAHVHNNALCRASGGYGWYSSSGRSCWAEWDFDYTPPSTDAAGSLVDIAGDLDTFTTKETVDISYRCRDKDATVHWRVELDGVHLVSPQVPSTGGGKHWKIVTIHDVPITAGSHTIFLGTYQMDSRPDYKMDWIKVGGVHIEAETYDRMGGNDPNPDYRGLYPWPMGANPPASRNLTVQIWDGDPDSGGTLLVEDFVGETTQAYDYGHDYPGYTYTAHYIENNGEGTIQVDWTPAEPGTYDIYVVVDPHEKLGEVDEENNIAQASIMVQEQELEFYPTHDAEISMSKPSSNYGSSTQMRIMNRYGHPSHPEYWERDALIRFDLSSISSGTDISSASLHLYYYEWRTNNPAGRVLTCYSVTSDWDEATVTWNTRPSFSSVPTSSAVYPSGPGHWIHWDVTSDVQAFINDSGIDNYGWQIMDEEPWGQCNIPLARFRSKEYGDFAPYLTMTTSGPGGEDCNGNGIPDEEDLAVGGKYEYETGTLTPFNDNTPAEIVLVDPPPATGDVAVMAWASADLDNSNEYVDVFLNDNPVGRLFYGHGHQCTTGTKDRELLLISQTTFNASLPDGITITLAPTSAVGSCSGNVEVRVVYPAGSNDCNGNSVPDECDTADGTSPDCNSNGVPDECELAGCRFPTVLSENTTGYDNLHFIGAPDDLWVGIGGQQVTYELDCGFVVDSPGPDFNVYEADEGGVEFDKIDVLVSGNGIDFVSVKSSEGPVVRIPGDEAHGDDAFARSYDLSSTGLFGVRYIRIDGNGSGSAGPMTGFDLDAIGAINLVGLDCNENGIPDDCDIAEGTSEDVNENGIPDECEGPSGEDCNGNGIADECDLDCGPPGGPCDLPGCGQSYDCQPNGVPDECDIANQGAGFDDVAAWATFDAGDHGVGNDPDGYEGAVFDGRYIYFVPYKNEINQRHGEVLRYDTAGDFSDVSSWATYDPGDHGVGDDPDGYVGGVFDGRYIYFAPLHNGSQRHGEVLRYDTTGDFADVSSWATYDPGDHGVGNDPDGYDSAVFDGRYIYFGPRTNGSHYHGEVLRYDTAGEFTDVSSWTTYDPGAHGVGNDPDGYAGVVFDGQYVYFAPFYNGSVYHGEVLRYNTAGDFFDASSWATFDSGAQGVGNDPGGYFGAVFDGRYVYFVPNYDGECHGEVLRYDTSGDFTDLSSWEAYNPAANGVGYSLLAYHGAVFDSRYVYFVPRSDCTEAQGEVLRYDTAGGFSDVSSWAAFDAGDHGVGDDPDGYSGAVFDGQYVYFSPTSNGTDYHGEVLRYDTWAGWSADCNENGVPDECDIAEGTSEDVNGNGIPDECEDWVDFEYRCVVLPEPCPDGLTTPLAGVEHVYFGEPFFVELWATDSGQVNTGLISVYADLEYTPGCASVASIAHDPVFDLFGSGTDDGTFIDELGGSQLYPDVGVEPAWARVAIVEFTADAICTEANFELLSAEMESSAFGRGVIDPAEIDYGSAAVEIGCRCIYDLDENCAVAAGDLGLFSGCWDCCENNACWLENDCIDKDFDCSGCVAGGDLSWFAIAWEKSCDELDPIDDYPPCRECDGPILCTRYAPAPPPQGQVTLSLRPERQTRPAERVQLALRLIAEPSEVSELDLLEPLLVAGLQSGEYIFAEVWARDDTPDSSGLTAVFTDVYYDPADFELVGIDPGETFTLFAETTSEPDSGVIRRAGGATMEAGHGAGVWTRMAIIELRALLDVDQPEVSVRPSAGEAVSARGRGLISSDQVEVLEATAASDGELQIEFDRRR